MIYVMLVEGETPFVSAAIKYLTGSRFSHCCFATDEKTYEAEPLRLLSASLRTYPYPYELYRIRDLTPEQEQHLIAWNEKLLQCPPGYDYGKVLGLGVYLISGGRIDTVRKALDNRAWLECYEHIWLGFKEVRRSLRVDQMHGVPGDLEHEPTLEFVRRVGGHDTQGHDSPH